MSTPSAPRGALAGAVARCLVTLAALSSACSETAVETLEASLPATGLVVRPAQVSLAAGEQATLVAVATLGDAAEENVTAGAAWVTSAPEVASLTAGGELVAVSPGYCQVHASWQGITSGPAKVTVTGATAAVAGPLAALAISPNQLTLAPAATAQLHAVGTAADGVGCDAGGGLKWLTSNTGVVVVDAQGLALGVAEGNALVTASVGAIASAPLEVRVSHGSVVSVTVVAPAAMDVGAVAALDATVAFEDNVQLTNPPGVVWQSDYLPGATVDANGLVKAMAAGPASITASYAGVSSDPASILINLIRTLLADFSNAGPALAGDWGTFTVEQGGPNSDGTHTLAFNAAGLPGNALKLSYTLDSAANGYIMLKATRSAPIDLVAAGITYVEYDLQATGSHPPSLCLDTPLATPTNAFGRYCRALSPSPSNLSHDSTLLQLFSWAGDPAKKDYTVENALGACSGFIWQVTGGAAGASGSLTLDNLVVDQTEAAGP